MTAVFINILPTICNERLGKSTDHFQTVMIQHKDINAKLIAHK